jgi:biotin carboxyl carrier protein
MRNKIPLADEATSGNLPPQTKSRRRQKFVRQAVREIGMPEIKIVTEVAGRVCALAVENGASVGDGDEIAFVEAMKMEIPVTSTTSGKIKVILVKLDDIIAEGQVVAIVDA